MQDFVRNDALFAIHSVINTAAPLHWPFVISHLPFSDVKWAGSNDDWPMINWVNMRHYLSRRIK